MAHVLFTITKVTVLLNVQGKLKLLLAYLAYQVRRGAVRPNNVKCFDKLDHVHISHGASLV